MSLGERMIQISNLAKFEIALRELAAAHGFELVELPFWTYGEDGISCSGGSVIGHVYSPDGKLTSQFAVWFKTAQNLELPAGQKMQALPGKETEQ